MPVCPLLCSLNELYSDPNLCTTKKAHKCTFSLRLRLLFLLKSCLSHWNSLHINDMPEAIVLTGVAQWVANETTFSLCLSHTHSLSSWLYLLSSVACLPNLSKSVLHLSSFGVNEGTLALHLSFSLTRGLLLDMSPWSHIKSDNTWTVQIEVPLGVSGYCSHSS